MKGLLSEVYSFIHLFICLSFIKYLLMPDIILNSVNKLKIRQSLRFPALFPHCPHPPSTSHSDGEKDIKHQYII